MTLCLLHTKKLNLKADNGFETHFEVEAYCSGDHRVTAPLVPKIKVKRWRHFREYLECFPALWWEASVANYASCRNVTDETAVLCARNC